MVPNLSFCTGKEKQGGERYVAGCLAELRFTEEAEQTHARLELFLQMRPGSFLVRSNLLQKGQQTRGLGQRIAVCLRQRANHTPRTPRQRPTHASNIEMRRGKVTYSQCEVEQGLGELEVGVRGDGGHKVLQKQGEFGLVLFVGAGHRQRPDFGVQSGRTQRLQKGTHHRHCNNKDTHHSESDRAVNTQKR
jgi:hypothetical protein